MGRLVIAQASLLARSKSQLCEWPVAWLTNLKLSRSFWLFFIAAFFFDCGFAVFFFLFNLYLLDFHWDERSIGLVTGALTIGSLLGTLPAGYLADKVGLRPMLLVCFVVAPILGILRASFIWLPAQLALAFLAGMAMCIWGVCFSPVVAKVTTTENRASAFSLIFSVSIGTSAVGELVCGYAARWLETLGMSIGATELKSLILQVSCGIALVGLIPLTLLHFEDTNEGSVRSINAPRKRWRETLRGGTFLVRFLPSMALWTAVIAAFNPFATVFLSQRLRFPLAQVGLLFGLSQVCQLGLGLLTPLLFGRTGLLRGIALTQMGTAMALLCLAVAQNRILAAILFLSFSSIQWMSSPGLYNLLMTRVPEQERSSASALTMFSNSLLQSVAAMATGFFLVRFGYPKVLSGIAILGFLAALLFQYVVAPAGRTKQESFDRRRKASPGLLSKVIGGPQRDRNGASS